MDALEIARHILAFIIPGSLALLGSECLGLALVLIMVDVPGGVNWSGIGAVCATIGGFGALGAAGGWIGAHILSMYSTAHGWVAQYGGQLIGGGVVIVALLGAGMWGYKHIMGKGIDAGGKGKAAKKVRSLFKAGALALVGATLAAAIPELALGLNWGLAHLHGLVA